MKPAVEAFPLAWPVGTARTPANKRQRARFCSATRSAGWKRQSELTIYVGICRIREAVEHLVAANLVISTNVPTRLDGLPYSKSREPDDPGVAVYFVVKGRPRCMSCDRWDRVADNMAAIAATIEAMRGVERWGCMDIERVFAGTLALPSVGARKPWWETLGFKAAPGTFAEVSQKYMDLIAMFHPDRGGNANQAAEINAARDEARVHYGEKGGF